MLGVDFEFLYRYDGVSIRGQVTSKVGFFGA
jgi:hypothetical protein